MKESIKTNLVITVLVVLFFASIAMFFINRLDRVRVQTIAGINHIRVVVTTDRNCNDCHLGASFVNLFNHPAVKGNDNTVLLMMDKAKIKRW